MRLRRLAQHLPVMIFGPSDLRDIIRCVEEHGRDGWEVDTLTAERQCFLVDRLEALQAAQDAFYNHGEPRRATSRTPFRRAGGTVR